MRRPRITGWGLNRNDSSTPRTSLLESHVASHEKVRLSLQLPEKQRVPVGQQKAPEYVFWHMASGGQQPPIWVLITPPGDGRCRGRARRC